MLTLPENYKEAVIYISDKAKGTDINYCFRGTTSLILQGYDMNVDDVDILTDENGAVEFDEVFKDIMTESVGYKKSPKFISHYGKFKYKDVLGEVYGDWQIKDSKGVWSEPFNASNKIEISYEGRTIFVTPVDMELACFAKMGRWTAFQKIKKLRKALEPDEELNDIDMTDKNQLKLF